MRRWVLLLVPLAACQVDTKPRWALDPIYVEPNGAGVHGFETWQIYSDKWQTHFNQRFYLCSVVVEIEGTPADPGANCPNCSAAWDIQTDLAQTDCDDKFAKDPGFLALSEIAIGGEPKSLVPTDPFPKKSQGAYADYGKGEWSVYGWAYPASLETKGSAGTTVWDGTQPFTFWPADAWDLAAKQR